MACTAIKEKKGASDFRTFAKEARIGSRKPDIYRKGNSPVRSEEPIDSSCSLSESRVLQSSGYAISDI
ncbi:MAG: hypothetical protein DRH10_08885 [Deltaproteobacteria bacterium]|nr:MAG: hypothetical protein DRH10_08885 [Deltaproteobacteria bacterium]